MAFKRHCYILLAVSVFRTDSCLHHNLKSEDLLFYVEALRFPDAAIEATNRKSLPSRPRNHDPDHLGGSDSQMSNSMMLPGLRVEIVV